VFVFDEGELENVFDIEVDWLVYDIFGWELEFGDVVVFYMLILY